MDAIPMVLWVMMAFTTNPGAGEYSRQWIPGEAFVSPEKCDQALKDTRRGLVVLEGITGQEVSTKTELRCVKYSTGTPL